MGQLTASFILLLFSPVVCSWGFFGHRTTALLASRFLTREAAISVRKILSPQNIVSASTWADNYSHTPEGRFSAPWHWIDALDSPPHSCSVSYSRDCPTSSGCIVSALVNQTARVRDRSLPRHQRAEALKWVIHFVADIHQPLHTENLSRGGNQIEVLWFGHHVNLHHLWDTSLVERIAEGKSMKHTVAWVTKLQGGILDGRWGNITTVSATDDGWGSCIDPDRTEECVLEWARQTNQWMCKYVLPMDYPKGLVGRELSGEYYDGAVAIIEEQISLAGWRMAGWLNAIFGEEVELIEVGWMSWWRSLFRGDDL